MKLDKDKLIKTMNSEITDEFLEMLTDEERNILYDMLVLDKSTQNTYNRLLSNRESMAITTGAYGYLLSMYQIKSISGMDLENILNSCVSIAREINSIIDKDKMDKIVTIYLFTGLQNVTSGDYLEMINTTGEFSKN
ncbi:MAG: hypothetical protein P9L91_07605 [Candidatus Zophobacter franzmannii]|nr:hypothetical protein [Candidatus Zophobacter franzmannii]